MSALQLLKVHHATPDGLLFQLGEERGFGRLGKEDMTTSSSSGGNDEKDAALGEKIMALLSSTTSAVPVVVTEGRDPSGYLRVSTDIADVSSGIWTLPPQSSALIRTLFKKTMVCPIGRSTSVNVSKVSKAGTLVTLPSGILGAVIDTQALEAGTAEGDVVNVFGLDLDSSKGIAIVAAGLPSEELEESAGALPSMGSKAECTILYSNSDMLCALVRPLPTAGVSTTTESRCCIGFIALDAGATGTHKGEKLPTAAGSKLICNVLFSPGDWLSRYCPFVLLTTSSRARPDRCRLDIPSTGPNGVAVTYPWRAGAGSAQSRRQADGEEPESRMKRRRMEEMIDEYERDPHHIPSSPDEFKKQLLGNPNSSFLWTQFIAYHLGLNQIEKARQTAEDALKTIGVRETNELFNIWVSYLNLENLNGTPESLNAVFKRSLQYADKPEKLYLALADIYENSGNKNAALLDHCRMMSSKYCSNPKMWVRYGCVLAKQNKRDNLKRLLRDMNQTLNKADQVEVVKSIAIFDFKNNSLETGRALLEGLLGKVPKRSDIWQVYLDQECAAIVRGHAKASVDAARTLFERISTLSLPPRAMQLHLTRYLDFEKAHGTAESVETIKQKARAYVESKMKDMGGSNGGGAITS